MEKQEKVENPLQGTMFRSYTVEQESKYKKLYIHQMTNYI